MRNLLGNMAQSNVSNTDFLSLQFESDAFEKESAWLVASYMHEVWVSFQKKRVEALNRDQLFGFLKFKFRQDQFGARMQLKNIPGLMD